KVSMEMVTSTAAITALAASTFWVRTRCSSHAPAKTTGHRAAPVILQIARCALQVHIANFALVEIIRHQAADGNFSADVDEYSNCAQYQPTMPPDAVRRVAVRLCIANNR